METEFTSRKLWLGAPISKRSEVRRVKEGSEVRWLKKGSIHLAWNLSARTRQPLAPLKYSSILHQLKFGSEGVTAPCGLGSPFQTALVGGRGCLGFTHSSYEHLPPESSRLRHVVDGARQHKGLPLSQHLARWEGGAPKPSIWCLSPFP